MVDEKKGPLTKPLHLRPLNIQLTKNQIFTLREFADRETISLSAYLRRIARDEIRRVEEKADRHGKRK